MVVAAFMAFTSAILDLQKVTGRRDPKDRSRLRFPDASQPRKEWPGVEAFFCDIRIVMCFL